MRARGDGDGRISRSDLKRDAANAYLRTLPPNGLLVYPDLDEFFDAPPRAIAAAAAAYGGFVLGHMVDRVAADWALRDVTQTPLWRQFPRRCAATHEVFRGLNVKWILVPARGPDGRATAFATSHHARGSRPSRVRARARAHPRPRARR